MSNYVLDNDPINGVTVILNIWKRDYIDEQIKALLKQTKMPFEIWIFQCKDYINTKNVSKQYPFLHFINSTVNFKYFGRFSIAQFVKSKYIYMMDDDVVPSENWLSKCQTLCDQKNAIISSAGRIIPKFDLNIEKGNNFSWMCFGDTTSHPFNFCPNDIEVDFGCNSWFFKKERLNNFMKIPPSTFDTGEDIHLSASNKIFNEIPTIVPVQLDETCNGNLKKCYGYDSVASWKVSGTLNKRIKVVNHLIEQHGWQPLLWSENN